MRHALLALALLAGPAMAQDCPATPDHAAAQAALYDRIRAAPTEMAARQLSDGLWQLWTDAPDARAQEMLDRGMRARAGYDFEGAVAAFDALTAYCPSYPEGYNQRAFVSYLRQDFGTALDDLERTLELAPDHAAALSGMALTLMGLGRNAAAQEALRRALALNPWLPERHLLLEPPGEPL